MQLEKIVIDWYTLYCKPSTLNDLKNCVVYISEYNIEQFKIAVNKIINDKEKRISEKKFELEQYQNIITFIKKHNSQIKEDVLQTDEILFSKENNSYIVIVKDVKDIRVMNNNLKDRYIDKSENDTIFIALFEEAQIMTVKDSVSELISEQGMPVFCLNIRSED